jgi:GNAT superfamily N-acetyltransferase
MPLRVRRATPADAAIIVEFNERLAAESEGKSLDRAILAPGVATALADEHRCLYFLGEDSGRVLGQMMVTYEWSDWRNGWIWWIQSVYVRAEARRQGVFKALYEHVSQAAREQGVVGLRLYVDQTNEVAKKTYARLGLGPTEYVVLERYPL